ncbi:MAG TPA: hypothetical protein VMZ52_19215 [Bryobacteraceae bacterium]|nr:hypothetical protein [Bryobacteraceae bacterium]
MARILVILICAAFLTAATPEETVVFAGVPSVRVDTAGLDPDARRLSPEDGKKYACRIVARKKKFYWASRGDKELIRSEAGDFTYFISPEGTGYIKIYKGTPGGAAPNSLFGYLEQLSSGLKTVTYFGKSTAVQ